MTHKSIFMQILLLTLGVVMVLHCMLLAIAPQAYLRLLVKTKGVALPYVSWSMRFICAVLSMVIAFWVCASIRQIAAGR